MSKQSSRKGLGVGLVVVLALLGMLALSLRLRRHEGRTTESAETVARAPGSANAPAPRGESRPAGERAPARKPTRGDSESRDEAPAEASGSSPLRSREAREPSGKNLAAPILSIPPLGSEPIETPDESLSIGTATLFFSILDARGSAAEGVAVTLDPGPSSGSTSAVSRSTVTDRRGEARFERLLAAAYDYRVERDGRLALSSTVPLSLDEGEERLVELRLPDFEERVRGLVVDQEGVPVAGLGVVATASASRYEEQDQVSLPVRSTTTDRDGRFEIQELAEGEYRLATVESGLYPSASVVARAGGDPVVLRVVENGPFRLTGSVLDPDGNGLAGVRVVPIGHSVPVSTDERGEYELPLRLRRLDGRYAIAFRLPEYHEQRHVLRGEDIAANRELRLDVVLEPLERTVDLIGRLADERGAPVVGQVIHLDDRRGQTGYQATSGGDGWFRFDRVAAAADYTVSIKPSERFRDFLLTGLDLSFERAPLEVVLEWLPLGNVRGVMMNETGLALQGYHLKLHNPDALAQVRQAVGDERGYFEVRDVPVGSIVFQSSSQPRLHVGGLTLSAGDDAYVELVLDVGESSVAGSIFDSAGAPVAGARVQLTWTHLGALRSDSQREGVTDDAGQFQFTGLGPGEHEIQVDAPGFNKWRGRVPRGESWVEIRLPREGESGMRSPP